MTDGLITAAGSREKSREGSASRFDAAADGPGMEDRMESRRCYAIRWARESEWRQAMTMVWETFLKFEGGDYTQEGIQKFFEFISDDNLYRAFLNGHYRMMVAVDGERVIGVGSIRNKKHLSLLFVDEEYQHRGVGSAILARLCDYLKKEAGERYMSLNAAPCAVDFYRKLGFQALRPEEEYSGIRVTAMEKVF